MFNNESFLNDVRNKQYHYFGNIINVDYDWYRFVKLVSTHPNKSVKWMDDRKLVDLTNAAARPSLPKFAHNILKDLATTFHKNGPSLVPFAGFTDDHESLQIHRDSMDVLYLQVLGEIRWSIWQPDEPVLAPMHVIQPAEGEQIWEAKFSPGDLIWIPRGVWHHVTPLGPRVGFSFGVEGDPDPSTYI